MYISKTKVQDEWAGKFEYIEEAIELEPEDFQEIVEQIAERVSVEQNYPEKMEISLIDRDSGDEVSFEEPTYKYKKAVKEKLIKDYNAGLYDWMDEDEAESFLKFVESI